MKRCLSSNRGSVFVSVMISALLMSILGSSMYQLTTYQSTLVNRMRKAAQAQELAEAGLAKALSQIRTSWSAISSSFPSTTLGPGTYQTTVTTSGGRYIVKTTGTVQGVSRIASAEVTAPSTGALNYVFAAGGNLDLDTGTGQSYGSIAGNVYAGGNITLDGPPSGGVLALTGSAYALGNLTSNASVTVSGSLNDHYTSTAVFPVITYSDYQTIAQANSQYFTGNKTYNSGTIPANPAGGVIYVTGNVIIRGTQSTTACIVAGGNIQIEKSGSTYPRVTVNQFSNYPAMMAQGNISFSSNGNGGAYLTTTGLVHANGNIQLSSGNHDTFSFTGSVIANGNIQTTGLTAWNVLSATYAAQSPPYVTTSGNSTMTIKSYNS